MTNSTISDNLRTHLRVSAYVQSSTQIYADTKRINADEVYVN